MLQNGRMTPMLRLAGARLLLCLTAIVVPLSGQTAPPAQRTERPAPPTRDPHTPGYVAAKELPDGAVPPAEADGNFIIGPTYNPPADLASRSDIPKGAVIEFMMNSSDSKIYPGIAREPNTLGPGPGDPAKLIVTASHPAPYTRKVAVYVPKQYVPGSVAPFIVGADGPDALLFSALDSLIAEHKVPAMIAISIGNGSGDAQGSERGLEYDTMSGVYAEFVEKEVLPLVESQAHVKLTKDPDGRATMGGSSGGSCALIMAWYHPELYHRVLTYSGTFINQQWPHDARMPHGAWEFHEHLIPESPAKPTNLDGSGRPGSVQSECDARRHARLGSSQRADGEGARRQGLSLPIRICRNAGHVDRAVKQQTLPEALEYLWQGYPSAAVKDEVSGVHPQRCKNKGQTVRSAQFFAESSFTSSR